MSLSIIELNFGKNFAAKFIVKFGIFNQKVHHFDSYHLQFKYIYHLDKAINMMIFNNLRKMSVPVRFLNFQSLKCSFAFDWSIGGS